MDYPELGGFVKRGRSGIQRQRSSLLVAIFDGIVEMSLGEGKALHPARFASTLHETGLMD